MSDNSRPEEGASEGVGEDQNSLTAGREEEEEEEEESPWDLRMGVVRGSVQEDEGTDDDP